MEINYNFNTNICRIKYPYKRDIILSMNMQLMASRWQCGKETKSVEQKHEFTKWAGRNGCKVVFDW